MGGREERQTWFSVCRWRVGAARDPRTPFLSTPTGGRTTGVESEFLLAHVYYCTIVLLYYYPIVLLYNCTIVLLYYCTIVLLYFCTIVLLYYCTIVLLYYCTYVLLNRVPRLWP